MTKVVHNDYTDEKCLRKCRQFSLGEYVCQQITTWQPKSKSGEMQKKYVKY